MESRHVSVLIVGAGMAGLGAAKTLSDADISDFLILEAQERVGGRTISIPIDDTGDNFIDLGAQWIHGTDNPVFRLAEEAKLLAEITFGEGQGLYVRPDGESVRVSVVQEVSDVVEKILEDCCQFVDESEFPNSVGEFLSERFNQYLDSCNDPPEVRKDKLNLLDWHKRYQIVDNSCDDLDCLSAKSWGLYKGGSDYNSLRRGYSSLVDHLTAQLPPSSIRTLCEVKQVKYSSSTPHVKVICENGMEFSADHVIVTCSLGYLKDNVHSLFNPPLPPAMSQTIRSLGFDTHNKLFLVYDTEWWSSEFTGIQFVWDSEENIDDDHKGWLRHVTGFDVMAPFYGVLLGWVGGEGAVMMESLSDQKVSEQCTSVIRRFMKLRNIPSPKKIFRSKWCSNKFIKGGFSYTSIKCDQDGTGPELLAQPVYVGNPTIPGTEHPAVLLAGEAVSVHFFATVHGAYTSGVTQADLIVNYIKSNRK